ncbi:Pyridoxine/pyridoxamine 5'-phosphate oxidase [Chlamydiales bacterium SCGC AG-110-M15]|nr:Pyridoxine/pyridoxamine 5'-phosphate oxidase [Chlamydiales bacterium SCGC AG-110-M15]
MMSEDEDMIFDHMRKGYHQGFLTRKMLLADPIQQVQQWLKDAMAGGSLEPNAMTLATASRDGVVSSRMVLLKRLDAQGFLFFTNYESAKARDLAVNKHVGLTFWWKEVERQVCLQGEAEKVDREVSEEYFASRGRESQLAAWASEQSKEIEGREYLDDKYADFERKFEGKEIECPENWGGYLVKPSRMEFWQGRSGRMHDRFVYVKEGEAWRIGRLAP